MKYLVPVIFLISMLALGCNDPIEEEEYGWDTVYVPSKAIVIDTLTYSEGNGPYVSLDTVPN
ncbi:MAG: hypothetical protein QM762_12425 [Chryseolinea sp.]